MKSLNEQAKLDRAKDNVYSAGARDSTAPASKRKSGRKDHGRCKCGSSDHRRTNHAECPLNKRNKAAEVVLQEIGEEQALLDAIDPEQHANRSLVEFAVMFNQDDDDQIESERPGDDADEDSNVV